MTYLKLGLTLMIISVASSAYAQRITGIVYEQEDSNIKTPLFGAIVYWLGTTDATSTNFDGKFEIKKNQSASTLIVSFVGLKSDTIEVAVTTKSLAIVLQSNFFVESSIVKVSDVFPETLIATTRVFLSTVFGKR